MVLSWDYCVNSDACVMAFRGGQDHFVMGLRAGGDCSVRGLWGHGTVLALDSGLGEMVLSWDPGVDGMFFCHGTLGWTGWSCHGTPE
jgi:hypothetical protein